MEVAIPRQRKRHAPKLQRHAPKPKRRTLPPVDAISSLWIGQVKLMPVIEGNAAVFDCKLILDTTAPVRVVVLYRSHSTRVVLQTATPLVPSPMLYGKASIFLKSESLSIKIKYRVPFHKAEAALDATGHPWPAFGGDCLIYRVSLLNY